jgi:hypothetical protein
MTLVVTATKEITMKTDESFDTRVLRWGGWVMGAFLTTAFALAGSARAQDPRRPPHDGHRRQPPPAAFEACKDKKADDACQVTFQGRTENGAQGTTRTIEGTCHDSHDGRLFCRPTKPPGPPPAPPAGR